jgi:hypothetical protein
LHKIARIVHKNADAVKMLMPAIGFWTSGGMHQRFEAALHPDWRAAISPARSKGSPSIDSSTATRIAGGSAEAAGRKLDEFDVAAGDCANTFIFQPSPSWHASPELAWLPVNENVRQ